ncbi:MAG TPA: transposase, partial [Thermoanaerobaculia bacterium]|nr:transposase [Thermoanaerobaculia bacterium]
MSRPLRIIRPDCLYHITSRGNRKQDIVRDDGDRAAFVRILADVVIEKRWILHAWVLMTNHIHLVVTTPLSNLSAGMRELLRGYSARFNTVHGLTGNLFHHRFRSKLVER